MKGRGKVINEEERPVRYKQGPGVYEIKPLKESPSYSMKGRGKVVNKEERPVRYKQGPGAYELRNSYESLHKISGYKIGNSERGPLSESYKLAQSIPGPGQYNNQSDKPGPQWKFGSEEKGKEKVKEVPGPGTYSIPESLGFMSSRLKL